MPEQTLTVLILRLIVIVVCSIAIVTMMVGFARYRKYWNEKTRDYWFARLMWCVAGAASCAEGIIRNTSFRYSIVFIIVAALVTLKGVLQRGSWGTPPEAIKKLSVTKVNYNAKLDTLPWSKFPWDRCAARREDYSRCDLKRKHSGHHFLDRGIAGDWPWSTEFMDS